LPGDNLCDDAVVIPPDALVGEYALDIGILDERFDEPVVRLAITGRRADGWYALGKINVQP
jgi:hypothetical protein